MQSSNNEHVSPLLYENRDKLRLFALFVHAKKDES